MGQPSINIMFQTQAINAIAMSEKGVVAIILKDANENGVHELSRASQIPETLGQENKEYIQRAFVGYVNPPRKVIVSVIPEEGDIDDGLELLGRYQWDYVVGPPDLDSGGADQIVTWIKSQRLNNHAIYKAVLPDKAADSEAIVNFSASGIKVGDDTFTAAQYCNRIAGMIAGTPMTISCTYATLPEVTDIDRLTDEEADAAEEAGKLVLLHDGVKVKLGRGVNSLTSTTQEKGEAFQKIKLVEVVDMIGWDIRRTTEDSYIGKFPNSYDNKMLLVMAIKGYLQQMELEGIVQENSSTVGIDVEQQEVYLTSTGVDISTMSEQEIKEANTGSQVFLLASLKILDAIEDISLRVVI